MIIIKILLIVIQGKMYDEQEINEVNQFTNNKSVKKKKKITKNFLCFFTRKITVKNFKNKFPS